MRKSAKKIVCYNYTIHTIRFIRTYLTSLISQLTHQFLALNRKIIVRKFTQTISIVNLLKFNNVHADEMKLLNSICVLHFYVYLSKIFEVIFLFETYKFDQINYTYN